MSPEPAIVCEDLYKAFGGRPVLRGVSFQVEQGETYTILGGSGSGKSVCLRHLIGLMRPDSGRVCLFGRDVSKLPEREFVEIRKDIGMVFQSAALFDSLSVFENIAYPLREHLRLSADDLADRVSRCLRGVGLDGIAEMMPAELSGGMRKRVGVARAIALEPKVILYDEPTTGLDPANSRRIGELIRSLQRELGVTSVVVTHDMELCFSVSDRIALLRLGEIASEGTLAQVRDTDHPELRAFIEGSQDPTAPASTGSAAGDAGGNAEPGSGFKQGDVRG